MTIYHDSAPFRKDRLYTTSPPPGVSHGLGYTGDGSGSVMPIEVTVSAYTTLSILVLMISLVYAWEG
jgi:hypothetical protein